MSDIESKLINICQLPFSKGGQKEVFTAEHPEFGKVVLKKILSKGELERTKREIRAAKIIDSDNVPKIFDHNCDEINPAYLWILEEYISGSTLREKINQGVRFNINELVIFLEVILKIAVSAENKNLVHRDIKPENIMIDLNNKFWLLDFGIARHLDLKSITSTNAPYGPFTIGYASSEQFRNLKKEISIRTDLFAIGVVSYEMLTGINPFIHGTNDLLMILRRIEHTPLPMLTISGDTQYQLATFIKILGDNRQSRRPRSAIEALTILNSIKPTLRLG